VPFELDPEALADGEKARFESYAWPSFEGFSDLVFDYPENRLRLIKEPELQRTYIDARTDLNLLVEEYRFEAILACSSRAETAGPGGCTTTRTGAGGRGIRRAPRQGSRACRPMTCGTRSPRFRSEPACRSRSWPSRWATHLR
jgi:hypothetical protein